MNAQKHLQSILEELIQLSKNNTIQSADELIERLTAELLQLRSLQI